MDNKQCFDKSKWLNGVVSVDGLTADYTGFDKLYAYNGQLGAIYSSASTEFRLWTPYASSVVLQLFDNGNGGQAYSTIQMVMGEHAVWTAVVTGDLNGKYYTYLVTTCRGTMEVVDPYAKSVGVNGDRGMVLDMSTTNPIGWKEHSVPTTKPRDAVIYEAHVRDLTVDPSSGVSEVNRGKYLGLTERGTINAHGQSTVVDHMVELGINYLHLLPIFDYASVDETKLNTPQFNWGYDPKNYNAPEGSYSSDPYHGEVRVNELKQAVMALHNSGIKVVMDVVYNHTYEGVGSLFDSIAPGYYHRLMDNGEFFNGSACGNETASERAMVRKFMVDSLVHWATEYKIDGFRFDLMGLHDIDTMNIISRELHAINPDVLIYGEGWTGGTAGIEGSKQSIKCNAYLLDKVGVFSDDIRDGIKGSVFDAKVPGFVNGAAGCENDILLGTVGAICGSEHFGLGEGYTNSPMQCINYVSAHDNYTLWDKLTITNSGDSHEDLINMNMATALLVLTGQGLPFMTNGEEIARTKHGDDNSYKSSDLVNSIKWNSKHKYKQLFDFYRMLIAWRRDNSHLLFATADEVKTGVNILSRSNGHIAYSFSSGDSYSEVHVNVSDNAVSVKPLVAGCAVSLSVNAGGSAVGSIAVGEQVLNKYGMLVLTK